MKLPETVKKKRYPVSQAFRGVSAAQCSGPALKWDYDSVKQSVHWCSIMIMCLFTVAYTPILVITQLKNIGSGTQCFKNYLALFFMQWNALCYHEFLYHLTPLCVEILLASFSFFPIFHLDVNDSAIETASVGSWDTFRVLFFFDRYHYITGYLEINQFVIHLVWVICYTLSKAGNPAWSSPTLSLLPNSESLLLSSTRLLTRKHVTREMCWTGALDASDSSLESCNYWSFVQCGLGSVYAFLTHYDL